MPACTIWVAEIKFTYIPKYTFPIDHKQTNYSSGPSNGVVQNKRVGGIFCLPFIGENASLCKNFKSYKVRKRMWAGFFFCE